MNYIQALVIDRKPGTVHWKSALGRLSIVNVNALDLGEIDKQYLKGIHIYNTDTRAGDLDMYCLSALMASNEIATGHFEEKNVQYLS